MNNCVALATPVIIKFVVVTFAAVAFVNVTA